MDGCNICTKQSASLSLPWKNYISTLVCGFCSVANHCVTRYDAGLGVPSTSYHQSSFCGNFFYAADKCPADYDLFPFAFDWNFLVVIVATILFVMVVCLVLCIICCCHQQSVNPLLHSTVMGLTDHKRPRRERETIEINFIDPAKRPKLGNPVLHPGKRPAQGIPLQQIDLKELAAWQSEQHKKDGTATIQTPHKRKPDDNGRRDDPNEEGIPFYDEHDASRQQQRVQLETQRLQQYHRAEQEEQTQLRQRLVRQRRPQSTAEVNNRSRDLIASPNSCRTSTATPNSIRNINSSSSSHELLRQQLQQANSVNRREQTVYSSVEATPQSRNHSELPADVLPSEGRSVAAAAVPPLAGDTSNNNSNINN